jgi:hypothetical protein
MEHFPSLEEVAPDGRASLTVSGDEKPHWSAWSRCESSFSLLLVPHKPGVFALAEEVIDASSHSRRMLAMFAVTESDDVARSVSQLFTTGHPLRERLGQCRCFVRYAVVHDAAERQAIAHALERWLLQASDRAAELAPPSLQATVQAPAQAVVEAKQVELAERAYYLAPQKAFLHSDFADCDPGDCTDTNIRSERAVRAVQALGTPVFPAGF